MSDEENVKNEVAPVGEERESSEEEAGGSSDELTDTDEQPVLMASTAHGKDPEDVCTRWSNKDKVKVQVQVRRPAVIREYNDNMGGVDLCDRMLSFYRMASRTKKWTMRVIAHFFDVALTNSWIQYKSDSTALNRSANNTEQYLDFKLHLADELLNYLEPDDSDERVDDSEEYEPPIKKRIPQPEASVRTSGARHMPEMVDCKHAERCRNQGCKGKTYMRSIARCSSALQRRETASWSTIAKK